MKIPNGVHIEVCVICVDVIIYSCNDHRMCIPRLLGCPIYIYMYMYIYKYVQYVHVQYAPKNNFHTVVMKYRLNGSVVTNNGRATVRQQSTSANKRSAWALFRPFQRLRGARVIKRRRHRLIVIPNATVLLQVNGARVSTAKAGTCC